MSQHSDGTEGADGGEAQCENCGAVFDDERGLKVHVGRWCTAEADGTVVPSKVAVEDIEETVFGKTEDELKQTLKSLDFSGKDSDTLQTKTAKAVLKEKGGGSDHYSTVFSTCAEDDCEWGCNGFEADHCVKHQPDDPEGSSADEDTSSDTSTESGSESTENTSTDTSVEVDGVETAKKIAQLREEVGLDWDEAAEAVEVLFG